MAWVCHTLVSHQKELRHRDLAGHSGHLPRPKGWNCHDRVL